jgi:ribose transport system substrate-binding protein
MLSAIKHLFAIFARGVRASVWVSGSILLAVLADSFWHIHARGTVPVPTIAFIPQTAGPMLWEMEHLGAAEAGQKLRCHLYWNTPTSEADVAGQVTLIERVTRGNYQGLVVAPNHRFSILSPLKRAISAGLPVVVVADRAAHPRQRFHCNRGPDGDRAGVTLRLRGAERLLSSEFPAIRVVSRSGGAYNPTTAEDLTRAALDSCPGVQAVLGLTASSTRGAHAALRSRPSPVSTHMLAAGCLRT